MSLLGIDLGTSNCKCVAFREDGKVLAQASVSYTPCTPQPDRMEIDAEVFWDAFVKTVRTVSALMDEDPVVALAVSSQGETIIPVDKEGNCVGPAIMNGDNRAREQIAQMERELGRRRIYNITGLPLDTTFGGTKIMWVRQNQPDLYAKTAKFLSCEDFILTRLGFGAYSSKCLCCRTLLMDVKKRCWSDDMLKVTGIDAAKLSEPVSSGQLIGRLDKGIAALLGLNEGTGVAAAGHDQCCNILGSGVTDATAASDAAGTFEGVSILTGTADTSDFAFANSINTYCHLFDDQFISHAFFPSGFTMNWMMDMLRYSGASVSKGELFARLDASVEQLGDRPTGVFVLPHLVGSCNPDYDRSATGTVVGITPNTRPEVLYKAIYESIAYEFAAMTRMLSHLGNYQRVHISGGGSKSDFTLALRAAVSGKPVYRTTSSEAVCQGAALLSGIAVGIYRDREDAVRKVIHLSDCFEPRKELSEAYQASETMYHNIYKALEPIRRQWSGIQE